MEMWRHHFPYFKSKGVVFRCARAANSVAYCIQYSLFFFHQSKAELLFKINYYSFIILVDALYLRNRFVLAVICCLIYHCLEVSRLKWIKSRARRASDLSTYD